MRARMFGVMMAVFGLLVSMVATPATAQVNINVNIGQPPPVIVHTRPTMVYLPEPAVYVAVGVPYDIYFVDGRYYYWHGDHWFWAHGYDGPWIVLEHRHLPPGLQKHKVVKLHEYRDREYRVYKVQGSGYKGKHFDADPGSSKSQGKPSNGKGRGRGK